MPGCDSGGAATDFAKVLITVEVGGDLWGSSGTTPLFVQGHLQQVDQDHVLSGFETSKNGDSTTFLGNPFLFLTTLRIVCCCCFFLCQNGISHLLCCPWATLENRLFLLLYSPHLIFIQSDKVPPKPSVLQDVQSQISQPPFVCQTLAVLFWSCCSTCPSPLSWEAHHWTHHYRYISLVLMRREQSPPLTC